MNADVPIAAPMRTSSNAIALSSAGIGLVTAIFYSNVGFDHAKSAYEAATGGSAGLSDYVTVGTAFWDGLPIAAAIAVIVGMSQRVSRCQRRCFATELASSDS